MGKVITFVVINCMQSNISIIQQKLFLMKIIISGIIIEKLLLKIELFIDFLRSGL